MNLGDAHRTRRERTKREIIAVVKKIVTADLVEVRQGGTSEEQGTWCNFFLGEYHRERRRFTIFNMQRLDRSGVLVVLLRC